MGTFSQGIPRECLTENRFVSENGIFIIKSEI